MAGLTGKTHPYAFILPDNFPRWLGGRDGYPRIPVVDTKSREIVGFTLSTETLQELERVRDQLVRLLTPEAPSAAAERLAVG